MVGIGDASVNTGKSCHAFTLETKNETYRIFGAAPVDVDPAEATSNRAELCTVLAMAVLISEIAKFFHIQSASISLFCDNAEAIRHPEIKNRTYSKYAKRDMDLKLAMQHVIKNSPVKIAFQKVEGHADDKTGFSYEAACQEVRRNIDMDEQAKKFLRQPPERYTPTSSALMFPGQIVQLQTKGIPQTGNLRDRLPFHSHEPALKNRIGKSFGTKTPPLDMLVS